MAERHPGIDGVSGFMGLRWDSHQQTRMEIRPDLINGAGFLSGVATYAMIDYTMGSALVLRFLEARNWPAGAAYAAGLILIMLVVITVYLWFINRGRQTRDVSVL